MLLATSSGRAQFPLPPLLLLLTGILPPLVSSFEAIPYIHIDFAFYHRLAQCQAKCTEKYGVPTLTPLLNGKGKLVANMSTEQYRMVSWGTESHFTVYKAAQNMLSTFQWLSL